MNWNRRHLTDGQLARIADQVGVTSQSMDRRDHLANCAKCTRLLEGHRRARAMLLKADRNAVPPTSVSFGAHVGTTSVFRLVGPIGVLVLVVGVALTLNRMGAGQATLPSSTDTSRPSVGLVSPSPAAPSPRSGVWQVLTRSDAAGAEWSPDGKWLLVWDAVPNGPPAGRHVSLEDARGNVVRTISGEDAGMLSTRSIAIWVDAHSFLIERGGINYLGTVEAAVLTPVSPPAFPAGVVSNGHGALAYALTPNLDSSSRFVVWTMTGGATPAQTGVPISWSRDGTELAVWHWSSGSGTSASGWLQVLSWPRLHSIGSRPDAEGAPFALFDPQGRYVYDAGRILDLASGKTTTIALSTEVNTPIWNRASQLLFPSSPDGSVSAYDAGGTRQSVTKGLGDSAASSADGSAWAFWFGSSGRPIQVIRNGTTESFDLPGVQAFPDPQVSPDGSGLVVACLVGNSTEVLLLAP